MIAHWFRINRPKYLRGFLSTDYRKELASLACCEPPKLTFLEKFILTNCLMNFFIRPDFIAYNISYRNQLSYRICTKLFGIVKVGWTIRSKKRIGYGRFIVRCDYFRLVSALTKNIHHGFPVNIRSRHPSLGTKNFTIRPTRIAAATVPSRTPTRSANITQETRTAVSTIVLSNPTLT